ncbi:tyrosine protein phosphatase [Salipaludibacillus agaradhaerens]|uniref:tyrosine-protein phosphatase n=1 Tax=Salipaludibacillus agaradhaerens TaxID=76935 RepID=UPI00215197A9|nr:CpsB/CapC family capsule biosynthesis tyrosine phosphatase [Salipaludibacillus agaradhaerens]MCR6108136.1 tyrosine protein phosphatase [Salipaludibacillus agaradhaerens]MCR6120161.1 tyrosine protein phosphatase [Salipaludibacillus agaradhaerens]
MIDIHCHILPGIDDGAQSERDLVSMAQLASEDGITTIVATPHHKNGNYENVKVTILKAVESANKILQKKGIKVMIKPGQECRLYGEIIADFRAGYIQTINDSKYLFVEFPSSQVPRFSKQLFYDLQIERIVPVIVHPERNHVFIKKPEILYEFVKHGALTQVTAGSVAGKFGKNITKFTFDLIESNLTHFIASDAHNTFNRTFNMTEAYEVINRKYGIDYNYYFKENAERLLNDDHVMSEQPQRVQKRKILGLF